jgi:hypothetical protein
LVPIGTVVSEGEDYFCLLYTTVKQFVAVFCMVLLLLSVCGHKGFPAITLALLDRSSEFLMQKTWPPHAILVSEWPIYKK